MKRLPQVLPRILARLSSYTATAPEDDISLSIEHHRLRGIRIHYAYPLWR